MVKRDDEEGWTCVSSKFCLKFIGFKQKTWANCPFTVNLQHNVCVLVGGKI